MQWIDKKNQTKTKSIEEVAIAGLKSTDDQTWKEITQTQDTSVNKECNIYMSNPLIKQKIFKNKQTAGTIDNYQTKKKLSFR